MEPKQLDPIFQGQEPIINLYPDIQRPASPPIALQAIQESGEIQHKHSLEKPRQLKNLLLSNQSGLSFEKHIDQMMWQKLPVQQGGLLELPNSPALSYFNGMTFIERLSLLMQKDALRVFNNITLNTLNKTEEKRQALIRSVGEMILDLVYESSVDLPEGELNLSREGIIDGVAKRIFGLVDNALEKEPSTAIPLPLIEAHIPMITKQLTSTLGGLSENIMKNFAQMGNLGGSLKLQEKQELPQADQAHSFPFAEQIVGIIRAQGRQDGPVPQDPSRSSTLQGFIDANQDQLISICAEFSFGALSRMCEDSHNQGLFELMRLGLQTVILGDVASGNTEIQVLDNQSQSLRHHFDGAKGALKELMKEMQDVFLEEVHEEINRELIRQRKSAEQAASTTLSMTSSILETQARVLSKTSGIPAEKILWVTRDAPLALASSFSNGVKYAFSGMWNRSGNQQKLIEEGKPNNQEQKLIEENEFDTSDVDNIDILEKE